MAYIVKSSLEILPWNEREARRLMKEKEEYLKNKIDDEQLEKEPEGTDSDLSLEPEMEDDEQLEKEPVQPKRRTRAGEN